MKTVIVIPAYQPGPALVETANELVRAGLRVVVVNDGSSPACERIFAAIPDADIVRHAVNLGKGAALRTGFNHALCRYPDVTAIVTADADGQHRVADILAVAAEAERNSGSLILGARKFDRSVPFRSRFGNQFTRLLFRTVHGTALRDTQTGLRAIPRALAEAMLPSTANGYEFELDMLITARQLAIPFHEVEIATVYIDGNASSHFNPLLDSMRIYFLLLRFSAASVMTALCDNLVFYFALNMLGLPVAAQFAGRICAVAVNFNLNRRMVFLFREQGRAAIVRYLAVVAGSGVVSYLSLMSLHATFGVPILSAKIGVETLLFVANFALLRDFVFVSSARNNTATDWTAYYKGVPWTARLTRKYTTRNILAALKRAGIGCGARLAEFGGGNSCFLDPIVRAFAPKCYHVVDTNPLGLDMLRARRREDVEVVLHQEDVMALKHLPSADAVLSVGLIEHFDAAGTARCVEAHFRAVREGGSVLISFPTPTWLYRLTRGLLETLRLWKFPDERPLQRAEVLAAASPYGTLVAEKTLWPLLLTQHLMLFRREAAAPIVRGAGMG